MVVAAFGIGLAAGYFQGGSATTNAPFPTPSPTASLDAHTALIARLPTAVFTDCIPLDGRTGAGLVASVTCSTPTADADQLLVSQWADGASMAANFTTFARKKPDGKCGTYTGVPASGFRSTWGSADAPLACYVNTKGAAIVLWEYPDKAVEVLSVRPDGDFQAAFNGWRKIIDVALS